jgi:hypothetical protein
MKPMATRKAKKKVTGTAEAPANKRGPAARPERKTAHGSAKGAPSKARKPKTRKASPTKPAGKPGVSKARPRKPAPRKAAGTKAAVGKSVRKPAPRKPASSKPAPRKTLARKPIAAKPPQPAAHVKPSGRATGKARGAGPTAKGPSVRRYDRPGHLDPKYAADLRRQSGPHEHDPVAFFESPRARDDLAEERGEEFVQNATTGEDDAEERLDQVVPEEQGGPFVETNAAQEFAHGTDPSNPKGAKREPFPTT